MKHAKHVEGKLTSSEASVQSKFRHVEGKSTSSESKNRVKVTIFALVLLALSVVALVFWWSSSKSWMLFVSMLFFGACLSGVGLLIKPYNKRLGFFILAVALVVGVFGMLDAVLPAQEKQLEYVNSDQLVISMLTEDNKLVHQLNTPGIIPDNVMQGNSLRIKTTPVFSKVISSSTPIAVIE